MKKTKPFYTLTHYKKINKIINVKNSTPLEIIQNFGLYCGDINLFKILTIYKFIEKTKKIKGDIIEFGVWKGNTSLLIKKILDIFNIKKKIILFDHFKGLQHFEGENKNLSKYKNRFSTNKNQIIKIIKFFKLKNIKIIDKDATKLKKNSFKQKFSLIIIDVDLYKPTQKILSSIEGNISKNGIILFDEGDHEIWKGENKALMEFYKKNKKKYKLYKIKFARKPDIYLKRIS